jgi:hypothetical protein
MTLPRFWWVDRQPYRQRHRHLHAAVAAGGDQDAIPSPGALTGHAHAACDRQKDRAASQTRGMIRDHRCFTNPRNPLVG